MLRLRLLHVWVALFLLLNLCSGIVRAKEILIWHAPAQQTGIDQLVQAFNSQNHGFTVRAEPFPSGNWTEKLIIAMAAGTPPEIALQDIKNIPQLQTIGGLLPISSKSEQLKSIRDNDLFPGISASVRYDGDLYGFPLHVGTVGFFYNTDWFAKRGIASDRGPSTWEQAFSYAKRLTHDTNSDGIPDIWAYNLIPDAFYWEPFLWQNGGDVLTPDAKHAAINTDKAVQAVEYLVEAVRAGWSNPKTTTSNAQTDFVNKKVGMTVYNHAIGLAMEKVKDTAWNVDLLPAKDVRATNLGATVLVVPAMCKAPDEAVKFVEWVARPDNVAKWVVGIGSVLPATRSANIASAMRTLYDQHPWLYLLSQQLPYARTMPLNEFTTRIDTEIITKHLKDVYKGNTSTRQAVEQMAKEIEVMINPTK